MSEKFERTAMCKTCGKMFTVENKRGQLPKYCPDCKAKQGGLNMSAIFDEVDKRLGEKDEKTEQPVSYPDNDGGSWTTTLSETDEVIAPVFDPVNHPSHYTEGRKYEPLAVILDWQLDYCLGNALKYISRAGRKGDKLEDLKKAAFYLNYAIEHAESEAV